jgi:hypothetical protein
MVQTPMMVWLQPACKSVEETTKHSQKNGKQHAESDLIAWAVSEHKAVISAIKAHLKPYRRELTDAPMRGREIISLVGTGDASLTATGTYSTPAD